MSGECDGCGAVGGHCYCNPEPSGSSRPFLGEWRHNNGHLCCGTIRIASEDFDNGDAPQDFKDEVMDWIADTLNNRKGTP